MTICTVCGSRNIQCLNSRKPPKIDTIAMGRCYCLNCEKEFHV